MKFFRLNQKGFSLIELMVVISIIGLLSSMILTVTSNTRKKARDKKRLVESHQIVTGLQLFSSDNNQTYPSSASTWKCLGHTSVQNCWLGAYTGSDAINTALSTYIKVPDDPLNNTACQGDAYLYNSNYTPAGQPNGAYLHWFYEDTSVPTSKACGRGVYGGSGGSCGNYCWLYVGPSNP